MDKGGEEEGEDEMNGESNMEYTLTHVKQIAHGNLLYDSGNSNWDSNNLEGWEWVGKVGGRFKREEIYVHLWLIHADTWQKSNQYCKAIINQLKINKYNNNKVFGKSQKLYQPKRRKMIFSFFPVDILGLTAMFPCAMSSNSQAWVVPGPKNVPLVGISHSLSIWLLFLPALPGRFLWSQGVSGPTFPSSLPTAISCPVLFPGGSPLPVLGAGVAELPQRVGPPYRQSGQWENENHFYWVKQGWESPRAVTSLSGTALRTPPSKTRTCWFLSRILHFLKVTDLTLGPEKQYQRLETINKASGPHPPQWT